MPQNVNPKDIRIGPGRTVPDQGSVPWMAGWTFHGDRPVDPGGGAGLVMEALKAHIEDPKGAHAGTAVSYDPTLPLSAQSVSGAIDELAGGFSPAPPRLGQGSTRMPFHCIPDWGLARLVDVPVFLRDPLFDGMVRDTQAEDAFPHRAPSEWWTRDWGVLSYLPGWFPNFPSWFPAPDPANYATQKFSFLQFSSLSSEDGDLFADRVWNAPTMWAGLPTVPRAIAPSGVGKFHAGAYTLDDGTVRRTARLLRWDDPGSWPPVVTVSGALFPADRGVLALVHIPDPTGSDPWDWESGFLTQDLLQRIPAALLLGQGASGDPCVAPDGAGPCDGEPGGIFSSGTTVGGDPDPFQFPGKATGQYDLRELHTGVSMIDGTTAIKVSASVRAHWSSGPAPTPAAGQVRLGTDPDAGGGILAWGIPVLGAGPEAYDTAGGAFPLPTIYMNLGIVGKSVATTTNFFRYRLPVLDDYSQWSGLKWTPRGVSPADTMEAGRYFTPQAGEYPAIPMEHPYLWEGVYGHWLTVKDFDVAGNYPPFSQDNFTWQIARWRHTFVMDGNFGSLPGSGTAALGTWILIHFKTEKDFETFALTAALPASVYGAHFVDEHSAVVNDWTDPAPFDEPPHGPASSDADENYGWASAFHHVARQSVFIGGSATSQEVAPGDVTAATASWNADGWGAGRPGQMQISGVWHQAPRILRGAPVGTPAFWFFDMDVSVDNAWNGCWKTDWFVFSDVSHDQPPEILSDGCPAALDISPFCWDPGSSLVPPSPTSWQGRTRRFEIPFQDLGTHGGLPFSETNGPMAADALVATIPSGGPALPWYVPGDRDNPTMSCDARLRLFIRRPLLHAGFIDGGNVDAVVQPVNPYPAGNGIRLALEGVPEAVPGGNVLFHSSGARENHATTPTDVTEGVYGNLLDIANPNVYDGDNYYPAWTLGFAMSSRLP